MNETKLPRQPQKTAIIITSTSVWPPRSFTGAINLIWEKRKQQASQRYSIMSTRSLQKGKLFLCCKQTAHRPSSQQSCNVIRAQRGWAQWLSNQLQHKFFLPFARVMTHCTQGRTKNISDPLPLSKNLILQNCVQTRDVINYVFG